MIELLVLLIRLLDTMGFHMRTAALHLIEDPGLEKRTEQKMASHEKSSL